MTDTKISGFPAITTYTATDEFLVARAGATNKITAANLRAAMNPDGVWIIVTKTGGDESVSASTTIQNDNELLFTAASGVVYEIEMVVTYASPVGAGTPDIKADFGEDATARGVVFVWGVGAADTATSASLLCNQSATATLGTATIDRAFLVRGWHTGNGGTWRLRWAQATSNANATIVRQVGTVLRYRAT